MTALILAGLAFGLGYLCHAWESREKHEQHVREALDLAEHIAPAIPMQRRPR